MNKPCVYTLLYEGNVLHTFDLCIVGLEKASIAKEKPIKHIRVEVDGKDSAPSLLAIQLQSGQRIVAVVNDCTFIHTFNGLKITQDMYTYLFEVKG